MIELDALLEQHGIPIMRARQDIYCQCPFCGDEDRGKHMGISLVGKGWGCWRNERHRGRDYAKVLSAVLGISMSSARIMLGFKPLVENSDLKTLLQDKLLPKPATQTTFKWPKGLRKMDDGNLVQEFYRYLHIRGFNNVKEFCRYYDLRYALTGAWKYRIVLPITNSNGAIMTLTGRTILDEVHPRYLTLSQNPTKAHDGIAACGIKDCLFMENKLTGGQTLVLCEGPFDALKLNWYGNVDATCMFGKTLSQKQIEKLHTLAVRYKRKAVILDADAALSSFDIWCRLQNAGFSIIRLPANTKDPGAMTKQEIKTLTESIMPS